MNHKKRRGPRDGFFSWSADSRHLFLGAVTAAALLSVFVLSHFFLSFFFLSRFFFFFFTFDPRPQNYGVEANEAEAKPPGVIQAFQWQVPRRLQDGSEKETSKIE